MTRRRAVLAVLCPVLSGGCLGVFRDGSGTTGDDGAPDAADDGPAVTATLVGDGVVRLTVEGEEPLGDLTFVRVGPPDGLPAAQGSLGRAVAPGETVVVWQRSSRTASQLDVGASRSAVEGSVPFEGDTLVVTVETESGDTLRLRVTDDE